MLKKRLASLLSLALCASVFFSGTAYAAAPEEANEDYVVTYSAEEITDADTLLDLALSDLPATISDDGITPLRVSDDDELTVDQLLERREYRDGHVEEDRCSTNLAIIDENGVRATKETIYNGNISGSGSGNNTVLKATLYYSFYHANNDQAYGTLYVKTSKTIGQVLASNLSVIPSVEVVCVAYIDYGVKEWQNALTFRNVRVGQSCTVTSTMNTYIAVNGYQNSAAGSITAMDASGSTIAHASADLRDAM